ncbi:MAG: GIY-YIG nuclease family protein [Candidatus Margulisiibacteriota bacterium]
MLYYVYILECSNKALYTGITTNLERRFSEHKRGKGGHYTTANPPVKICYFEEHSNRSSALIREAQIKGWSRTKKLALFKGDKGIQKSAARCRKGAKNI